MLYNLSDANHCCQACATFEECQYFSYDKDPNSGSPWYQACYIKNSNSNGKANNAVTAGAINRTPPPPYQCKTITDNTDYDNGWLSLVTNVPSASECCQLCANYPGCNAFVWMKDPNTGGGWYQRCLFKASTSNQKVNNGTTAGVATPITPAPQRPGKRGVAWFNSKSCSDLKQLVNVSWLYNWATLPDASIIPCMNELGIQFVPMQWGAGGLDTLNETIWGSAKYFLGFNEPNFQSQSNVLPEQAATLWAQIEDITLPRGMKLGSPSASACGPNPETECYGGSSSPVPWFDAFFGNCSKMYANGCHVDFIATHIYTCDVNGLSDYLATLKKYNLPIWLTEFACPAAGQSEDVETAFMQGALTLLEGDTNFGNYAWFGTRLDPSDGWLGPQVDLLWYNMSALTDLGKLYTTFKQG